jgi:hypothetical protein
LGRRRDIVLPTASALAAALVVAVVLLVVRIEPSVAAALVAGAATILGSALSVTFGRYFERLRELEERNREKKSKFYEDFMNFWLGALFSDRLGKPKPSTQQVVRAFSDWTATLTFWAPDEVVRQWSAFRLASATMEAAPASEQQETLFRFEQVLFAMRRDSGYPWTSLSRGDLLRLWVNDIDRYL